MCGIYICVFIWSYHIGMSFVDSFTCFVKVGIAGSPNKPEDLWLNIFGGWLTISKKVGQQVMFLLPLDLVCVQSGEEVTKLPNSLLLKTSPSTGSHELWIVSTSRIEIILLYQALNAGWDHLRNTLRAKNWTNDIECEYQISHGRLSFSKQTGKLVLSQTALRISDKESLPIHDIISMSFKQGDPNCNTRLIIVTRGATKQREFQVAEMKAMKLILGFWRLQASAMEKA